MSNTKMENKCELCGLRVHFEQRNLKQSKSIEDFFGKFRFLQKRKIIPRGYPRVISASIGVENPDDASEICAINHSSWRKNDKKCKFWQPDIGLTLGEYLSLHEARKIEILTKDIHKLTTIAAFITVIYLIIEIYHWLSPVAGK